MSEQNQAPDMSPEQAADFAALQAFANDAPPVPGSQEAEAAQNQPAPRMPLHEELSGMLKLVSKMIRPALPTVADIYTDETCDALGAGIAPVCEKYGWLQGGINSKYGEEIMCLVIVGPIAWATMDAAKTDLAALRDKKKAKPQQIGQQAAPVGAYRVPGSDTVTFGAPIEAAA